MENKIQLNVDVSIKLAPEVLEAIKKIFGKECTVEPVVEAKPKKVVKKKEAVAEVVEKPEEAAPQKMEELGTEVPVTDIKTVRLFTAKLLEGNPDMKAKVAECLKKYGANKLSAVPEDKLGELLADLEKVANN